MRQNNIFYNLIKNETSLTEAFCNLLSYKPFRDMFLNMVQNKNREIIPSEIEYTNFDTEIRLQGDKENKGRSDLHLLFNNTEYIFEIKINKFTKPTDNQPVGYLQYLSNDKENDPNRRLFFIIPKGYNCLDEICMDWIRENNKYTVEQIREFNLIHWEDIISEIKNSELDQLNLFINEFKEIVESKWLEYAIIEFTKFEIDLIFSRNTKGDNMAMLLDTNIPKIVSKLFHIVDDVYEKLETMIDKSSDRQGYDAYGFRLLNSKVGISDEISIWFGVDFEIWEKLGFPLTIHIIPDEDEDLDKILKLKISKKFEYDEDSEISTFIGFDKNIFENPDSNIVEMFLGKIYETIDKAKAIE